MRMLGAVAFMLGLLGGVPVTAQDAPTRVMVFVDDINTSFQATPRMRQAVKVALQETAADTVIGVSRPGGQFQVFDAVLTRQEMARMPDRVQGSGLRPAAPGVTAADFNSRRDTALHAAISAVKHLGAAGDASRILLYVSDGYPTGVNVTSGRPADFVTTSREAGVRVLFFAPAGTTDTRRSLRTLADAVGGNSALLTTLDELRDALKP